MITKFNINALYNDYDKVKITLLSWRRYTSVTWQIYRDISVTVTVSVTVIYNMTFTVTITVSVTKAVIVFDIDTDRNYDRFR